MRKLFVCAVMLALAALPAAALERVIPNGIDLWQTSSDGSTFVDFKGNPIPAGFFCANSEPFTGRIGFKGVPIASDATGGLGSTDTIVQRLDDAVFNKRGIATTRIQMRSLSMVSIHPVKTSCGSFLAKVSLAGDQPITRMRIIREGRQGGRFEAPIWVNAKISFVPVTGRGVETLELLKEVRFPPLPNPRWAASPGPAAIQKAGFVIVDTDGDGATDTFLPGTTPNFTVGRGARSAKLQQFADCFSDCHTVDDEGHCVC
jgi:hypothetical protein